MMERLYHAGIGEPLRWIAQAVFQPAHCSMSYEPGGFRQRGFMLVRLIVPLFLFSWLLVMLVRLMPLPAHLLVWSNASHQVPLSQWGGRGHRSHLRLDGGPALRCDPGVSFGIVFGLPGVYGMLHTDVLGAWLIPALGLAAGLALSLSFGLTWGLAFGVVVGLAAGIGIAGPDLVADLVIGLGFSLALSLRGSMVARLEISLIIGIVLGVIGGLTAGLPGGLASVLAAGLGSMLGLSGVLSFPLHTSGAVSTQERAGEDPHRRPTDRA